MENKNKLTVASKLALCFSKKIDSNLALYIILKDLNKYFRYLFYFFLVISVPAAVFVISKVLIDFNTFDLSHDIKLLLQSFFNIITIFVFFVTSLIVFYESIIVNNLDFKQMKKNQKEINEKKSFFIKLWMRLLLYFLLLLIILSFTSNYYSLLFPFIFMIFFIIYIEYKIKKM
jgi:L-asparagine transporter-like permease